MAMARQRDQQPPQAQAGLRFRSSLSRIGLSIKPTQGHALSNAKQRSEHQENEDEWYIPYNGPVELSSPSLKGMDGKAAVNGISTRGFVGTGDMVLDLRADESSVRGSGEDGPGGDGLGSIFGNHSNQSYHTSSRDGHSGALGSIFGGRDYRQRSSVVEAGDTDVEEDDSEEIVRGDMDLRARYGYPYASDDDGDDGGLGYEISFHSPLPSASGPAHSLMLTTPTSPSMMASQAASRPRAASNVAPQPAGAATPGPRRATVSSGSHPHVPPQGGIGEAPMPTTRHPAKPGSSEQDLSHFHFNQHHYRPRDTVISESQTSISSPPTTQYSIFTASPPQTYSAISSPPGTAHGTIGTAAGDSFVGRFSKDSSLATRDSVMGAGQRLSLVASLFGGFKGKGKERDIKVAPRNANTRSGARPIRSPGRQADFALEDVIDITGDGPTTTDGAEVERNATDKDNVIATPTFGTEKATPRHKANGALATDVGARESTFTADLANANDRLDAASDVEDGAAGADADDTSDAYYNTYYATLLSTPSSAYSSFKTRSPKEIPPLPTSPPSGPFPMSLGTRSSSSNLLPREQSGNRGDITGRESPRIEMGGFGKKRVVQRRDTDPTHETRDNDGLEKREDQQISSNRQAVHPYANFRAFAFPSSPKEDGDDTDPRDENEGGGRSVPAKSRPPKLTFTAPSQHSSPLTGHPHTHPHTHPNAHLHLESHPYLSPPPLTDGSNDSQPEDHSPPYNHHSHSRSSQSPSPSQTNSPSRALQLPHPLQHLHHLRNRLKSSMSTPNLRTSAGYSGSLSPTSSRSSAVSPTKPDAHSRKSSKSKIQQGNLTQRSQSRPTNITTSKQKSVPSSPHTGLPKGLDRWLSAETWCDALFLPKPRLKLKGDDQYYNNNNLGVGGSTRRIVSPPGSPVARDYVFRNDGTQVQTLESRVLAHSRSLADLRLGSQSDALDGEKDRKGKGKAPARPATADASSAAGKRSRGLTLPSSPIPYSVRPATESRVGVAGGGVGSGSGQGTTGFDASAPHVKLPKPLPHPGLEQADENAVNQDQGNERPPRPKSWALDDLALPSPAPSLMTVLAEGQLLEHQRRKWQAQAQKSFQNERSRTLSRSRSKSVNKAKGSIGAKGQGAQGKDLGKLEYLAARAVLGNQDILPISTGIRKRSLSQSNAPSYFAATDSLGRPSGLSAGSTSHGHSRSLSKTISKSSHSRNHSHSRNSSWSKTAFNKITQGTVALCGIPGGDSTTTTPETEHPNPGVRNALEGALKGDHTQVIRLPDPASQPLPGASPSPTYGFTASSHGHGTAELGPGSVEGVGVGIAISTPTPSDYDRESIHLPDHPYAQTTPNAYHHTYIPPPPLGILEQHVDAQQSAADTPTHQSDDDAPSQASSRRHPYAHLRDSYQSDRRIIGHPRPDSSVAPQAAMWAPIAPGVVHEVLPDDIRYSPFIASEQQMNLKDENFGALDNRKSMLFARNSRNIFDTVALGETLAMALEGSRDGVLGTGQQVLGSPSRNNVTHTPSPPIHDTPRVVPSIGSPTSRGMHREAVTYDASRPLYRHTPPRPTEAVLPRPTDASTDILPEMTTPVGSPSREASDSSASVSGEPLSPSVTSPVTSESSSPRPLPRPLGHISDDLEHFRDLFYRPDTGRQQSFQSGMEPPQPSSSHTSHVDWTNVGLSRHRTASSGLTSLVRKVSEELEELTALAAGAISEDSASSRYSSVSTRRDSEPSNLRFVISDASPVRPPRAIRESTDHISIQAFRPSATIPEDVESSAHGSLEGDHLGPDDDDDDPTERFRIGAVEALPTPPSLSYDRRFSEHLSSYITQPPPGAPPTDEPSVRVLSTSSLHPSTLLSRTSYMTSSDGSRMSGLSDFPVPPLQDQMTPGDMSVLNSYFEDVTIRQELASQTPRSPQATLPGDEEVDFAMALSSRPSTARPRS
ncbi:hypothetical protein ONZ45_g7106 [Pleurotus djamor]|nr:hypothetical protein ONZ45_g7106 [Pleurotus djamor]